MHEKSLAIRIKVLGPEHAGVVTSYNNMAVVYKAQGRLGEALELYEKSLAIRIKVLGPEHADVAASYNNMANVYAAQGRLGEALELHEKSLAIKIKVLGPEHADVAKSYNNMASVYKASCTRWQNAAPGSRPQSSQATFTPFANTSHCEKWRMQHLHRPAGTPHADGSSVAADRADGLRRLEAANDRGRFLSRAVVHQQHVSACCEDVVARVVLV